MDKDIKCACGEYFVFTDGEQKFYEKKGFTPPKRCEKCRLKKRAEDAKKVMGGDRDFRPTDTVSADDGEQY